jgi:nicotinamide phosphoribosyltransferase
MDFLKVNLPLGSDSYKMLHADMYPPGTTDVFDYFEARTGAVHPNITVFGLQYILKAYLAGKVVEKEDVDWAAEVLGFHFGGSYFDRYRWDYIVGEYGGMLPVRIRAVPEGMTIPVSNILMSAQNTDPKCFWLPGHLETWLVHTWYPTTVCTLSRHIKQNLAQMLNWTADDLNGLPFKLHDFGYRGATCIEAAGIGGMAHLVNFLGTDTLKGVEFALKYYNADLKTLAFSIRATEHNIMTAEGRKGEAAVIGRLLDQNPTGLMAMVMDSYNIYDACKNILGGIYRQQILDRDGVLIIRPDSGEPTEVVPKVLGILGDAFGTTINRCGYKLLNPKVRMIWGDGVDHAKINEILNGLEELGWSSDNIAFGMGGGLLQKVNRDTERFAFKSSAQKRNGEWHGIWKDPVDKDGGSKASKTGLLGLRKKTGPHGNGYETFRLGYGGEGKASYERTDNIENGDILETVFENGVLLRDWTFDEIRERARITA